MTDEIKYLDIAKFREEGYLQELNRLFLHPLGLALEVMIEEDGSETLGRIWDYRDDPEGMLFGNGLIQLDKINKIAKEWTEKSKVRQERYGFVIQDHNDLITEVK